MVATTAPGQTAAISVFIDPIITELGLSRSLISAAYLVGTFAGALAMPMIDRVLDRYGIRRTLVVIGLTFFAALFGFAAVNSLVGLTVGFVAIRMAGQGALGRHHHRRALVRPPPRHRARPGQRDRYLHDLSRPDPARTFHRRPRLAHHLAGRRHHRARADPARGLTATEGRCELSSANHGRPGPVGTVVIGVASIRALEAITFSRQFGTRHLGAIRGDPAALGSVGRAQA